MAMHTIEVAQGPPATQGTLPNYRNKHKTCTGEMWGTGQPTHFPRAGHKKKWQHGRYVHKMAGHYRAPKCPPKPEPRQHTHKQNKSEVEGSWEHGADPASHHTQHSTQHTAHMEVEIEERGRGQVQGKKKQGREVTRWHAATRKDLRGLGAGPPSTPPPHPYPLPTHKNTQVTP